ncbi:MAG TPA: hypothetical protein VM658_05010 [bacterium]|nr:hypothetical protein [bacterium]
MNAAIRLEPGEASHGENEAPDRGAITSPGEVVSRQKKLIMRIKERDGDIALTAGMAAVSLLLLALFGACAGSVYGLKGIICGLAGLPLMVGAAVFLFMPLLYFMNFYYGGIRPALALALLAGSIFSAGVVLAGFVPAVLLVNVVMSKHHSSLSLIVPILGAAWGYGLGLYFRGATLMEGKTLASSRVLEIMGGAVVFLILLILSGVYLQRLDPPVIELILNFFASVH